MSSPDIKEVVKEKYGQAALRVTNGGSSCCEATASSGLGCDPITTNLYDSSQAGQIPEEALLASLGCGNPTAGVNNHLLAAPGAERKRFSHTAASPCEHSTHKSARVARTPRHPPPRLGRRRKDPWLHRAFRGARHGRRPDYRPGGNRGVRFRYAWVARRPCARGRACDLSGGAF